MLLKQTNILGKIEKFKTTLSFCNVESL